MKDKESLCQYKNTVKGQQYSAQALSQRVVGRVKTLDSNEINPENHI